MASSSANERSPAPRSKTEAGFSCVSRSKGLECARNHHRNGRYRRSRQTPSTVSYTHLDVYKRQGFGQFTFRLKLLAEPRDPSTTTVSYTHLDVYKRQILVISSKSNAFGAEIWIKSEAGLGNSFIAMSAKDAFLNLVEKSDIVIFPSV